MSKYLITGGNKLKGEIDIQGSKNAVLPIFAATVLNGGLNVIKNCPKLKDVELTLKILKILGCKVKIENENTVIINSSTINKTEIPHELANEMRSSIVFVGPLLSKFKKVTISYPGVCAILLKVF